jgi:hypothetical protein
MRVLRLGAALLLGIGVLLGGQATGARAANSRMPDLFITTMAYHSDCEAETLTITATVRNGGGSPAGTFATGLDINNHRLKPVVTDHLPSKKNVLVSWTFRIEPGIYEQDRTRVDIRNRIRERSDTNNSRIDSDTWCD